MAEDYLSDREQEEALRIWWRENWRWIIGGVALGLGLLGGFRYWQVYRDQRADHAAQAYSEFQSAMQARDFEKAGTVLTGLDQDHKASAYVQQARLLLAKTKVEEEKIDEAISLLKSVSEDARDDELAQIARLRTARLLIQQGKHDDAIKLIDAGSAGAFAAQVSDVRGDAFAAKGDDAAARAEYAAALAANADAQIDRTLVELKLHEAGGEAAVAREEP